MKRGDYDAAFAEATPMLDHNYAQGLKASPRNWRSPWYDCFGNFQEDCAAWSFASACPCVAFGYNMNRVLGLNFLHQAVIFFLLLIGSQALVFLLLFLAMVHDAAQLRTCMQSTDHNCGQASTFAYNFSFWIYPVAAFGIATYGAWRRSQIRKKLNIQGNHIVDCVLWYFVPTCALAQETRTVMEQPGCFRMAAYNAPSALEMA